MRILFLSHYFPPEVNAPANRTYEHCREWVAAGHEVHVVTCVPSHPGGVPFHGYRSGWYQRETCDGIVVHRVWTLLAPNAGILRRTVNFLSFVPTAVWRALRLGRFDVVVGTSPQFFCALAACLASALTRTPWIFELRDLWPESIPAVGAARPYMPLRLLERLELAMYRHARGVVCVSDAFRRNLVGRGIDASKIDFIPNGVDAGPWEDGCRVRGRALAGASERDLLVVYAGTLGMAHDLGTMLGAAGLLQRERSDVRFLLVGAGAELETLRRRAAADRLTNVGFTGLVPRETVPDYLAASDLVVVPLRPSPVFRSVLPSKMFEAMAAARPIVLAVEGEASAILERAGAGVAVPPGDARALAAAIQHLADDGDLRGRLGAAGRRYVGREFSRRVWARRYLDVLDRVQPTARSGAAEPTASTS